MAFTLYPALETHDKEPSVNVCFLPELSFADAGDFNTREDVNRGFNPVVPKGCHEPECVKINVLVRLCLASGLKKRSISDY